MSSLSNWLAQVFFGLTCLARPILHLLKTVALSSPSLTWVRGRPSSSSSSSLLSLASSSLWARKVKARLANKKGEEMWDFSDFHSAWYYMVLSCFDFDTIETILVEGRLHVPAKMIFWKTSKLSLTCFFRKHQNSLKNLQYNFLDWKIPILQFSKKNHLLWYSEASLTQNNFYSIKATHDHEKTM